MPLTDPEFPPLLCGHGIAPPKTPFNEAVRGAKDKRFGAADVLWGRVADAILCAIVLEPEVSREEAQQMMPLAIVAMGDCLGALMPPQVAVTFRWPGTILVNNGEAGCVRAAMDERAAKSGAPDWLVVGVELRLKHPPGISEPGDTPHLTTIADEGGDGLDRTKIIESYSRHFLTWLNIWQDDGFKPIADAWSIKAEGQGDEICLRHQKEALRGTFLGLDQMGNLLLKADSGETKMFKLHDHFESHKITTV